MTHKAASILERAGSARRSPSFTLIETMVAVGALAFVAVGIAVIFETTGKTITAGKRVSAFNSYASLIEHRLRGDISAMTHEGFLVIRNAYATNSAGVVPVPLYDGDLSGRQRRIDELMFFAKGQFVSARQPLVPGIVARSDAARIYYGQGQRRTVDTSANGEYLKPPLNDFNATPQGNGNMLLGAQVAGNPNRYASDWTLLRQVTLLAPPQTSHRPMPKPVPAWLSSLTQTNLDDDAVQVALQPAASSIFRSLQGKFPAQQPATLFRISTGSDHPYLASGVIDIAAVDLSTVRDVVNTADSVPTAAGTDFFDPTKNNGPDGINKGVDGKFRPQQPQGGNDPRLDPTVLSRMQQWMSDALPGRSDGPLATRVRVRYEPAPTNVVGVDGDSTPQGQELLADQLMLSASNFLPRCTEFIVEWSFGKTYPTDNTAAGYDASVAGQIVWHGLKRTVNQGVVQGGNGVIAKPYDTTDTSLASVLMSTSWTRRDGQTSALLTPPLQASNLLIHAVSNLTTLTPQDGLTSYFGYFDPNFDPDKQKPDPANAGQYIPGADGKLDAPGDSASATLPWPWPKLIRITISLADPADPSVERTFQYVFDVPQDGAQ